MPTADAEAKETFDSLEDVKLKAADVARLVQASPYTTLFTGAGLSTSAGIPDFRGPNGVWTLKAQGRTVKRPDLSKAAPTVGHMICKQLLDTQHVKHICSQNVDGLHRKSGIPREKLSELHGNTNLEFCEKCGRDYFREFRCRRAGNHVHDHKTGRICTAVGCNGNLLDSIVNFGEDLPEKQWNAAEEAFSQTALCIVLGSSCRVTPAADLPEGIGKRSKLKSGPKLVIVNLQETPLDGLACMKVHARTDEFLALLAAELGLAVPAAPVPLTDAVTAATKVSGTAATKVSGVKGTKGGSSVPTPPAVGAAGGARSGSMKNLTSSTAEAGRVPAVARSNSTSSGLVRPTWK